MSRLAIELYAAHAPPFAAQLEPGLCAVLEPVAETAASLIALCSGLAASARGRALLDERAPYGDAALRGRIGALQAVEALPAARTVREAVAQVLTVRGDDASAGALLEQAGLSELAARRPEQLGALETRSVALALALAHPAPALLALFDPLATRIPAEQVCAALARVAEQCIVLATVGRFEDARALGGRIVALGPQGFRELGATRSGARALRVRSQQSEQLYPLLADAPEVLQVTRVGAHELVVHGEALEPLARLVAARAHGAGLALDALREQVDPYVLGATPPRVTPAAQSNTPEHMRPIFGGRPD